MKSSITPRAFKFSTYAIWWIRQAVTRAIANQSRTIRIPVHLVEITSRLLRVQRDLTQRLATPPSAEQIALEMEFLTPVETHAVRAARAADEPLDPVLAHQLRQAVKKVQQFLRLAQDPLSLEMPVGEENASVLGDLIEDDKYQGPVDATTTQLLKEQIRHLLTELNERERVILEMRFGLIDGQPHTLKEIGHHFGVTRERIRQLEAKALDQLRLPNDKHSLRDYLDP